MLLESSNEIDVESEAPPARQGPPEWREVDRRLREYRRHRSALDAAEAFDLVRAEQLKVYIWFGCVSQYDYMERVLGYRPHTARERMRVARALAGLPETTAALARGERTYSAVRELTRVATDETEASWLAATEGMVANQIERLVANHQVGDRPEYPTVPDLRPRVVRLELPPEVHALWRQACMVVATERGAEISDADFVETLCRGAIAPGSGEGAPAHQIAYQQCPDCRRATQNGAGREIDVSPEVFERASCDAKVIGIARCGHARAGHDHGHAPDPRAGVCARSPSLHGARVPIGAEPGCSPPHRAGPRRQARAVESHAAVCLMPRAA